MRGTEKGGRGRDLEGLSPAQRQRVSTVKFNPSRCEWMQFLVGRLDRKSFNSRRRSCLAWSKGGGEGKCDGGVGFLVLAGRVDQTPTELKNLQLAFQVLAWGSH